MKNKNLMKVVVVKDLKLEAFLSPFVTPHLNAAIRSFYDEAQNPESIVNKHMEDYELYYIGDFDTESAELIPQTPLLIACANDNN